jgi:hypothetical protein
MLVFDLGYVVDPESGKRRRKQKVETIRGTKKKAEARLAELIRLAGRGEYVEPANTTVREWLWTWLAIATPQLRPATVVRYTNVIDTIEGSALGALPLQRVTTAELEGHYAAIKASASTVGLHHTVLGRALRKAKRTGSSSRILRPRWTTVRAGCGIPRPRARTVGAETWRGNFSPASGQRIRKTPRCMRWRWIRACGRVNCAGWRGRASISTLRP